MWSSLKFWMPQNLTFANFGHPVSRSWLRPCDHASNDFSNLCTYPVFSRGKVKRRIFGELPTTFCREKDTRQKETFDSLAENQAGNTVKVKQGRG